jgi:hypothetical protein
MQQEMLGDPDAYFQPHHVRRRLGVGFQPEVGERGALTMGVPPPTFTVGGSSSSSGPAPTQVPLLTPNAESIVLDGISSLFKAGKISNLALCTYHNQSDYENFSELLTKMNFTVMPTEGYMIFYCDNINILPPYLRKGVIRAKYNL